MVASTSGAGHLPQSPLQPLPFKPATPSAKNSADPVVEKTSLVSNGTIESVATAVTSAAPPKKHVWKTVTDRLSSPFKYLIAKVMSIFLKIADFFSNLLNDDDSYPYEDPMVCEQQDNTNAIKQWKEDVKEFENNATVSNKLIKAFDISNPHALLALIQVPDTLSSSSVQGARDKIAGRCDYLDKIIGGLEGQVNQAGEGASQQPLDPKLKPHLLVLQSQKKELDVLRGEVEKFLKEQSSENVLQLWQTQFQQSSGKIAKEFEKIQQNTLTTINQIKPPIKNHKDLKICNDYFKIYQALETHGLIADLDKYGIKSLDILARHQEIIKLSGALSVGLEQGIANIGNTCWLNSAIQSMRKSPVLLALIKAPLQRKPRESDADWADRNRIHQYIKNAIYAVEFGEPSDVESALRKLRKAMISTTNVNIVPGEIANPNRVRDQHDVSYAFICFLTVVDYQVKFAVHRKVNNAMDPMIKPKSEIACKFPPMSSTMTMQEFLEKSAIVPPIQTNDGMVEEENRFAELPRVLVVQVSRFGLDETSQARLMDITTKIRVAIQNEPGVTRDDIIRAGEAATGVKGSQLTGKIGRPINLQANEILDLRTSFLTDDLPADRQNALYQLVGASCHFGGMEGGHYIAVGRKPDGTWWEFDDGKPVTPLTQAEVNKRVSRDGYQLIWERYTGPMPTAAEAQAAREAEVKGVKEAEVKGVKGVE